MSAWAMAALNGHFECFRILEQIVPTIAARKQFFEMQDDFGRSFMHLAAISGYSRLRLELAFAEILFLINCFLFLLKQL
jgi:hypothetical protein